MSAAANKRASPEAQEEETQVFTVKSGGETYGLPIDGVQTIFHVDKITPVPGAPPEIVGLINLRGKINTAVSLRLILGTPEERSYENRLAINIDSHGEQFALVVDDIGDVVLISEAHRIHEPPNAVRKRAALTRGVYQLHDAILPVLDVNALLDFTKYSHRAALPHRPDGVIQ